MNFALLVPAIASVVVALYLLSCAPQNITFTLYRNGEQAGAATTDLTQLGDNTASFTVFLPDNEELKVTVGKGTILDEFTRRINEDVQSKIR